MFAVCVATIRHDESGVCWHAATDIAADVETDDAAFELPTEVDEGCGCWRWRGHVKRDRTRRDMLQIRRFQDVFARRKWQEEGWEGATGYEDRTAVGASLLPPLTLHA